MSNNTPEPPSEEPQKPEPALENGSDMTSPPEEESAKKKKKPQKTFRIPEHQAIFRIVDFLQEEEWESLRNFLAAFIFSSRFLERDDIREKLEEVSKPVQKNAVRSHFRTELLKLLSPRLRSQS